MIVVVDRRRNVVRMLPYFYNRFLVRRMSQLTAQEKNAQNKTKQNNLNNQQIYVSNQTRIAPILEKCTTNREYPISLSACGSFN